MKEKSKVFFIDNFDSFTYNLVDDFCKRNCDAKVYRADTELAELKKVAEKFDPDLLVISPGPGTPDTAGVTLAAIDHFKDKLPIFGVCLGHQCIGEVFGGTVRRAGEIVHGKTARIFHTGHGILAGLPQPFEAIRYHSLVVDRNSLPDCLEITAWTENGLIMGLRHREWPVEGVQFHPESIMTQGGKTLLKNFLTMEENGHVEKIHR